MKQISRDYTALPFHASAIHTSFKALLSKNSLNLPVGAAGKAMLVNVPTSKLPNNAVFSNSSIVVSGAWPLRLFAIFKLIAIGSCVLRVSPSTRDTGVSQLLLQNG